MLQIPVGDQPADIEAQIHALILSYITNPAALLLAVTPANQDLSTSEAIHLIRQVDPAHQRTIGVLTKLDLMDGGTHAGDILRNKQYPLALGWIGLVNRSQAQVKTNTRIEDALEREKRFFANHPIYRSMQNECGSHYLAKTLNKVRLMHQ